MKAARLVTAQNLHTLATWCHGHTWGASVVVTDATGMEQQARIGDTIVEFVDGHFDVQRAPDRFAKQTAQTSGHLSDPRRT